MSTKKWRFTVTALGAAEALAAGDVDAGNWMAALRAAREHMGEAGGLPAGASCAVSADGVATVLDGTARRRYVLAPVGTGDATAPATAPAAKPAAAKPAAAATAPAAAPARQAAVAPSKPAAHGAPAASTPASASATAPKATAQASGSGHAAAQPRGPLSLELLLERNQDPDDNNPLRYRERVYLVPVNTRVAEVEALLRAQLASLQRALASEPTGKLVNLAVFDHRWQGTPDRPPLIVLQWRDWRDETTVDYPAQRSSLVPPAPENDERLAEAFEELQALTGLATAADGLDFAVRLLERLVPSEAISACLYDINTDELRFVALAGTSASDMQGHAVPSTHGLLAVALRADERVSVFANVAQESAFDPGVDGRPFLDVRDLAYRPISHEGQLLGLLHLANRKTTDFTRADAALIDYVGRQLAEFLRDPKVRGRAPSAKGGA